MKRRLIFVFCAVVVVALTVGVGLLLYPKIEPIRGAESPTAAEPTVLTGSGEWGSVINGLKCRVTTDKREYRISEPVRVLVEVANAGPHPVTFGRAEIHLSAIQGDRDKFPYFFSTTLHEFPHKTESGNTLTLHPGKVWQKTVVVRPWGPTYGSSPSVASPGVMSIEARFVYRPDSTSAGQSVQSSVTTFEAKE